MIKRKSRINAYSLLEMLLVMAILIIFGSFGVGGFVGFRETMFVRENVEIIKQDILLAQEQATLVKRGVGDNWLYGVGIDFGGMTTQGGTYSMIKWCSPFTDFGNTITRSKLLGWDPSADIGDTIKELPEGSLPIDDGYMIDPVDPVNQIDIVDPIDEGGLVDKDPPTVITPIGPEVMGVTYVAPFVNGYMPVGTESYTTSCVPGTTSLVEFKGEAVDRFVDAGEISLLGYNGEYPIQYLVFEAVTGKAFLYDSAGRPVNYSSSGGVLTYDGKNVLDILITRRGSTKFDVLSIYPSSGAIVHHVYSNEDLAQDGDPNTITVDGKIYHRFGIFDDISSYRD